MKIHVFLKTYTNTNKTTNRKRQKYVLMLGQTVCFLITPSLIH